LRLLLDTHIWVWWLTGDPALSPRERAALDAAANAGGLSLASMPGSDSNCQSRSPTGCAVPLQPQ
jgi:hypothetical protein